MVHIGSKTRSLSQIIEEPVLVTVGYDLNSCFLMLYYTIVKAQVSDLVFVKIKAFPKNKKVVARKIFMKNRKKLLEKKKMLVTSLISIVIV